MESGGVQVKFTSTNYEGVAPISVNLRHDGYFHVSRMQEMNAQNNDINLKDVR